MGTTDRKAYNYSAAPCLEPEQPITDSYLSQLQRHLAIADGIMSTVDEILQTLHNSGESTMMRTDIPQINCIDDCLGFITNTLETISGKLTAIKYTIG